MYTRWLVLLVASLVAGTGVSCTLATPSQQDLKQRASDTTKFLKTAAGSSSVFKDAYAAMLFELESVGWRGLDQTSIPCYAFRSEGSAGEFISVHWLGDSPSVGAFVIKDDKQEFKILIHPDDAASNAAESETSVVFHASLREADIPDGSSEVFHQATNVELVGLDGNAIGSLPIHNRMRP